MSRHSQPRLLLLHAVRLLGFADTTAIATHAGTEVGDTVDHLGEAQHLGWVQHVAFADLEGWSLTESGKIENERQLAIERHSADPTHQIEAIYEDFLPLNARLLRAVTDWQISPTDTDRFAPNDHSDSARDDRIIGALAELSTALAPLVDRLCDVLARFDGYAERFETALSKAKAGHHDWVDKTHVDSCHQVWFQLHEDLVATLGIDRYIDSRK